MQKARAMTDNVMMKRRRRTAYQAFALAIFSCVFGLMFCLVKSPQSRAESYLAIAMESMAQGHAHEAATAAMEAVRLNPASPQGWKFLSKMLRQNGQEQAARQAQVIALRLQQNPGHAPVYAVPAELKLSLLALAEADLR